MLRFEDFFPVNEPEKTKVKFNMKADGVPAWDYLMNGEENPDWIAMNAFKRKQANNNLKNTDYLLAFAQYYPYGANYYIFGGMYAVKQIEPEVFDRVGYKLTLLQDFKDFRKRLIIRLKAPIGRNIYTRRYNKVQIDFNPEVYELAPSTKLGAFPGYNNVHLTFSELKTIMNQEAPEWKNALAKVKGVYCITDIATGKLYIGAAYGNEEGIWQRWSNYADTQTGGNEEFKDIKKRNKEYIKNNFTYTILEIMDIKASDDEVIAREAYWKKVFKTREFGMNEN